MKRSVLLLASIVAPCVAIDQLTKLWADSRLREHGVMTLIPRVLDLRYVRNRGAFFSLGEQLAPELRRTLFVVASLGVLFAIAALFGRDARMRVGKRIALALLSAGVLGNLADRLRDGEVIDFIYLHAGMILHWATFNFADVWIVLGLALIGLESLHKETKREGAGRPPRLDPAGSDGGY